MYNFGAFTTEGGGGGIKNLKNEATQRHFDIHRTSKTKLNNNNNKIAFRYHRKKKKRKKEREKEYFSN